MSLIVKKIICSYCGKEHITEGYKLIPMLGFDGTLKQDIVYLSDTGALVVSCACGYTTTLEHNDI